ncbi:bifunctional demethylmenaquinone methyltransferase/2-methoxy-6-polyprenyl-1,4-benzoquinol methylase UbiE [Candidatus Bandiella euplotis]|nr:bifunctional demethylmenaquinone methyltransferase/2-methoxy-6-polyprenyl-1,4-benzoquinol methylase UbiE [Candidatus Bandiella woodruffii]
MKTNFGFQKVKEEEKEPKVQEVFSNVAERYDIMNDLMSFGLHRIWKDSFIKEVGSFDGKELIDLAGGTGDIARRFIDMGGKNVTVCDLNQNMLKNGKFNIGNKFNKRYTRDIKWVHANAEELPFADESFDYCTISFGIRNVTHVNNVLEESFRVLKPGGKFLCLEFSKVENSFVSRIYDAYSFKFIPKIGKLVTHSESSYRYLVESIRQFYHPEELAKMMRDVGYYSVNFRRLSFGVVAIHTGYKV